MKVEWYEEDTGITSRSLRRLRDTLLDRVKNQVVVVAIPTDSICCGFMIIDDTRKEAIWSGDGFRMDDSGEGGEGYRSAKALLTLFGLREIHWDPIPFFDAYPNASLITKLLEETADQIVRNLLDSYQEILNQDPRYIRGL